MHREVEAYSLHPPDDLPFHSSQHQIHPHLGNSQFLRKLIGVFQQTLGKFVFFLWCDEIQSIKHLRLTDFRDLDRIRSKAV